MRNFIKRGYDLALRYLPEPARSRLYYHRWLGLRRPVTFNEKIIHRKLFERDPSMPALIDKIDVKAFVAAKLGDDWIIPTYFAGNKLPFDRKERNWPAPFVIKPSHSSGKVIFVESNDNIDWGSIDEQCDIWVKSRYGRDKFEWAYSELQPRIIVEQAIGGDTIPTDFKFFVFSGRVHYVEVDKDRHTQHRQAFYDRDWKKQPFVKEHALDEEETPRPASLDRMIAAAEKLGEGWSFVRVDFYETDGQPKFGEITFYPASGRGRFTPDHYDRVLGDLWH